MSVESTTNTDGRFWHPPLTLPHLNEESTTPVEEIISNEAESSVSSIEFEAHRPVLDFFIYRQERIGRYNEPFNMYKFRTMKHGAHKLQDNFQKDDRGKVIDDDRYTMIGRWLKRKRIDEMPQIVNVLRGEMSVVGPRPHSRKFYEKYIPSESKTSRQIVKPGILKPMMAFSDYDFGGLEYRCDDQFIKDQALHSRTNVLRYLLRAIAPQKYKRVLDPSLPRYSKKDFFTPRFKQE